MNDIPRPKPSCQTCRFVNKTGDQCRKYPPQPGTYPAFPPVLPEYWCGEYQPNDEVASQFKEEAVEDLVKKAHVRFESEVRKRVEADTRAWVERFVRDHAVVSSTPVQGSGGYRAIVSMRVEVERSATADYGTMLGLPVSGQDHTQTVRNLRERIVEYILQYASRGEDGGMGEGEGAK